jgi:single-stranded-DNA-specific exonuclease
MRWIPSPNPNSIIVKDLAKNLQVPYTIAHLLVQRGVISFEDAKLFFRPEAAHLHDPFLMKDMDRAIQRIERALSSQEKIMVFGDYDVDGTTSVALVASYLKDFTEVVAYIPDRYKEGYGISIQGIDEAHKLGVTLIIALDCGIKANEETTYAKELGIDFIICDHHLPGPELPSAYAVLDPKRDDCTYPFKELCGCGIGFKLIQAVHQTRGDKLEKLFSYFDLVAIAIAADIVPINGENRVFCTLGLKSIRTKPRAGLYYFLQSVKHPIQVSDLVFVLAPRINAAGRMEKGHSAVELLMAEDSETALRISRMIEFFNTERRSTEERITIEALQQIELQEDQNSASTVVYHPSWHKGVIGIVASRLIESYYRPTVVLTQSEGVLAGSVRSVSGFDVYEAIASCEEHLIQFGGHKYAAGITLAQKDLESFKKAFEQVVSNTLLDTQKTPSYLYDTELSFDLITSKFYRILQQMEPFGPQNMRPVFVTFGCTDAGGTRIVGKDKTHLKLEIKDTTGNVFSGIAFGQAEFLIPIKEQKPFSILYTLEENEFNGVKQLQLKVKDIKFE